MDLLVRHIIRKAVCADEQHGPLSAGLFVEVDPEVLVDAQRSRDEVLAGVTERLLLGDLTVLDHLLNEGVVPGDLPDGRFIDDIGTAVPRVRHIDVRVIHDGGDDSGPHPGEFRVGGRHVEDLEIGVGDGSYQQVSDGGRTHVLPVGGGDPFGDGPDSSGTCDVSADVAAHAVTHDSPCDTIAEFTRGIGVLVAFAHLAGVCPCNDPHISDASFAWFLRS